MKHIQLRFVIGNDYSLKSVIFDYNDSGLPSDSALLKNLAMAMLKSLVKNKESIAVQDLLNELDIEKE